MQALHLKGREPMTDHEKNVQRIKELLQLVSCPDMKPGELETEISIRRNKAAIYCRVDTNPEKIAALVDQHADAIAAYLNTWGID